MAVSGRKQKKAAALFLEKICFKQHGGMGQGKTCMVFSFQGESRILKKDLLSG
mgnify:CR=1 FL=1